MRLHTQPNSGLARTGTVRLGGATLRVDQSAGASTQECNFALAPVSRTVGPQAEDVTLQVRAPSGCGWSASSRAAWIVVRSGDTGTGNGSVSLAIANNTGLSSRTGTVVIAGITFTVEQAERGGLHLLNQADSYDTPGAVRTM